MTASTFGKGIILAGMAGVAGYLGWMFYKRASIEEGEPIAQGHKAKSDGSHRRRRARAVSTRG